MAHGLNSVIKRAVGCKSEGKTGVGSRRIFAPHFKLQVLDSYRNDADCKGNQRATARKYGIHRRQIQKWLQAENNLRNSVGKGREPEARKSGPEMALSARQRDDTRNATADERVPALTPPEVASAWPPAPLDFTTHSRTSPDPYAPMDLSLKRPPSVDGAPVPCCAPISPRSPSPTFYGPPADPDVWDLSIKRRCVEVPSPSPISAPKPVKLFKPYLDDVMQHDNSTCSEDSCPRFTELTPPCCSVSNNLLVHPESYYFNNNNIICDLKSEYPYTIHELQPNKNYYYTVAKTYMYPAPDYDHYSHYEESHHLQSSPPLIKQRQSYSLDFKLRAIECYYQDSVCRGNQRAVASKYNIHRRQVQKWLQQEDELRQRNESVKQMHAVR